MFNPVTETTTRPIGSAALEGDAFDYNSKRPWISILAAWLVFVFAVIIIAGKSSF